MAKTHRLKSWPDFFSPLLAGSRTFDIRKNDKNFAVGDTVVILEFDDRAGKFTGRELRREIVSMGGSDPPRGWAITISPAPNRHIVIGEAVKTTVPASLLGAPRYG